MAKTKLTDKQARFVDEYLKDLNASKAAIRAGYQTENNADKIGSELLGNPRVKEEIRKRQEKIQKRTEITQDWVVNNLKKVFERCMQEEPVFDKEGNFNGVFDFEPAGANKSLELLGKHLGMFADKLKVSNDGDKPFQVEKKTKATIEILNQRINDLAN